MTLRIGLIPAAGKGVRAYPATSYIPKVMLRVGNKPLILRNIEIMRDALGIRDIYVITGYMADNIKAFLGDGSAFGVVIRYINCPDPSIGLAQGVLLAKGIINEPFATILGDELYIGADLAAMNDVSLEKVAAACGLMRTDDPRLVAKNYSAAVEDGRITSLIEKPEWREGDLLGCGAYLFTPEVFDAIERTDVSKRSGRVELTDALGQMAREGRVAPFYLSGTYCNVNTVEDYNYANYLYRSIHFSEYKVSVVIPAYNEEDSIGYVIRDFKNHVEEVFVIDNSSKDRTAEVARSAGARVETVKLTGYGDTIRHGLDHAIGDILVVVEADHSFRAKDMGKFLEYLKDADMAIGTRTTRQLIEQGANMRGMLRWGNVIVGKLIEALWWSQEPRFTDVGCSYRAIWREAWAKIGPACEGVGPEFSPEMMIEALRARLRVIEIPISYHNRITGESKHSASWPHIARTALKMLRIILKKRLRSGLGAM